MPCLRGIEVWLTTEPDDEQIPEYPHPEGASARIVASPVSSKQWSCPNGRAIHGKADPTVSVYMPSIPETAFAINYRINNTPPPPCKYVFFRLYINGRLITAWGIDPSVRLKGRVVKSLWAPCGQYSDQIGLEGRSFVFLPGQEYKSVAEDGGLIEIQVFRAIERRARAPRLEEFRVQENYGIAAPSIGLLDEPQDACFYAFRLLDARDEPFASFKLHYRSWKSLKELNLIPATELEFLLVASPKALQDITDAEAGSMITHAGLDEQSSYSQDSDGDVFQDCKEEGDAEDESRQDAGHYFLRSPPERFPISSAIRHFPQPSKALRDANGNSYLQRPLPEPPTGEFGSLSRRSSAVSSVVTALSITPSLQQDVDEGSLDAEDTEVGVAQLVRLPQSESSRTVIVHRDTHAQPEEYSDSDYETSPPSTNGSFSDRLLSPGHYLPTTGSGFEKGLELLTTPKRPRASKLVKSRRSRPGVLFSGQDVPRSEGLISTKPEYANRSPSPIRTGTSNRAARRSCDARPGKMAGGSGFLDLLKKLSGSPRKLKKKQGVVGD
ncbi:hypothetical protein VTK56DRAFT_9436 [Thermocarpiscus australiensis]